MDAWRARYRQTAGPGQSQAGGGASQRQIVVAHLAAGVECHQDFGGRRNLATLLVTAPAALRDAIAAPVVRLIIARHLAQFSGVAEIDFRFFSHFPALSFVGD